MRRRYVRSTLTIVLSGIAVLAVVMVWGSGRGIVSSNVELLSLHADRVARVVEEQLAAGHVPTVAELALQVPQDRQVTLRLVDGATVVAGTPVPDDRYAATAEVPGFGTVTIAELPGRIDASRFASAASIVVLAVLVSVVSVVVAVRQGRRLAAPLVDLAAAAERLGQGDSRPAVRRYGIPELDAVAVALDSAADRINGLVADERLLTVDASHQLRAPLTALSMRLEEILAADDLRGVREEAAAALDQVERLAAVVDGFLVQRSAWETPAVALPVDDVVRQQLAEWAPAFAAADRRLALTGDAGLAAPVAPGAVAQVLAGMLENSLQHGAGTTTVRRRRLDGAVCLEVGDEGQGIPSQLRGRVFDRAVSGGSGTGMGLALARATAESVGGRLELVNPAPARFALFLPVPHPAPAASAAQPGSAAPAAQPGSAAPAATGTLGNTQVR